MSPTAVDFGGHAGTRAASWPGRHASLAVLAATAMLPVTAASAPVPDMGTQARLAEQLAGARHVRVRGAFGERTAARAVLDSAGVRLQRAPGGRVALIQGPGVGAEVSAPIPWREIAQVQVGVPDPARGAAKGALVGGVLSGVVVAGTFALLSRAIPESERGTGFGLAGGFVMTSMAVGALIGSNVPRWQTVYGGSSAPGKPGGAR